MGNVTPKGHLRVRGDEQYLKYLKQTVKYQPWLENLLFDCPVILTFFWKVEFVKDLHIDNA